MLMENTGFSFMKTGMITAETRELFKNFITGDLYATITAGLPVTAIGLTDGSTAIGAITGFIESGNTFTMSSLYVAKGHRRKGGGTLLINSIRPLLTEAYVGATYFSCIEGGEDFETIPPFMEAIGAYEAKGLERQFKGPLSSLFESSVFRTDAEEGRLTRNMSELSSRERVAFEARSDELDFGFMGAFKQRFKPDTDLSFVSMKNESLNGYLQAGFIGDGDDELMVLLSEVKDPRITRKLLIDFVRECRRKLSPDVNVVVPVPDERYDELFARMAGFNNIQHNFVF